MDAWFCRSHGEPGQMGMATQISSSSDGMIPHHDGGDPPMADLALTKSRSLRFKALAKSIKASRPRVNAQIARLVQEWYGQGVSPWGPGSSWGWRRMGPMGMGNGRWIHGQHGTEPDALSPPLTSISPPSSETDDSPPSNGRDDGVNGQTNSSTRSLRQFAEPCCGCRAMKSSKWSQWYRSWTQALTATMDQFLPSLDTPKSLRGGSAALRGGLDQGSACCVHDLGQTPCRKQRPAVPERAAFFRGVQPPAGRRRCSAPRMALNMALALQDLHLHRKRPDPHRHDPPRGGLLASLSRPILPSGGG